METPLIATSSEFSYLVVAGELAQFYMGYSWLIECTLPQASDS